MTLYNREYLRKELMHWERALEQKTPPQKFFCPHCNKEISKKDYVCPHCYEDLKKNCPNCGAIIRTDWKRCPHCNKYLDK